MKNSIKSFNPVISGLIIMVMSFCIGYFFARGFSQGLIAEQITVQDTETKERFYVVPMTGVINQGAQE